MIQTTAELDRVVSDALDKVQRVIACTADCDLAEFTVKLYTVGEVDRKALEEALKALDRLEAVYTVSVYHSGGLRSDIDDRTHWVEITVKMVRGLLH